MPTAIASVLAIVVCLLAAVLLSKKVQRGRDQSDPRAAERTAANQYASRLAAVAQREARVTIWCIVDRRGGGKFVSFFFAVLLEKKQRSKQNQNESKDFDAHHLFI